MAFSVTPEGVIKRLENLAVIYEEELKSRKPSIKNRFNPITTHHYDQVFAELKQKYPDPNHAEFKEQQIPWYNIRTTKKNYVAKVKGKSEQEILFFAHCDSIVGPGINDNKTGVETLLGALENDLNSEEKPEFTHTYVIVGSEEAGKSGIAIMLGCGAILSLATLGITAGSIPATLGALALSPSLFLNFGIAGSKKYISSLTDEEKRKIKACFSVDMIGDGEPIFINTSLGGNFINALFPYKNSRWLNNMLKESVHEINKNRTDQDKVRWSEGIIGATSDHASALEVNYSLGNTALVFLQNIYRRLVGKEPKEKITIPATLLVQADDAKRVRKLNGRTSKRKMLHPFGYLGTIHTKYDNIENINHQALRNAIEILNLAVKKVEYGTKADTEWKQISDHEHAKLYQTSEGYFLGLKGADKHDNNLNHVYKVKARLENNAAFIEDAVFVKNGLEKRLNREMIEISKDFKVIDLEKIIVGGLTFEKQKGLSTKLSIAANTTIGKTAEFVTNNSFLSLMGAAFLGYGCITSPILDSLYMLPGHLWYGAQLILNLGIAYTAYTSLSKLVKQKRFSIPKADNLACLKKVGQDPKKAGK